MVKSGKKPWRKIIIILTLHIPFRTANLINYISCITDKPNEEEKLTDARLWKLAQKITSAEDLYTLAISGLGVKEDTIAGHLRNNRDSIAMASLGVLKDWRGRQYNYQVAYTNICDALGKAEMDSCVHEILL